MYLRSMDTGGHRSRNGRRRHERVRDRYRLYPDLEAEDVREAMHYAAEAVRERELPLAASG